MMILTSSDVRLVEQNANDSCISYLQLMENAGAYCARVIRQTFENTGKRKVLIVCGKGKNGGDGFVIARKLTENGYNCIVMMASGFPKDEESSEMLSRIRASGITIVYFDPRSEKNPYFDSAQIIVDCVFGIGFRGTLDDSAKNLIERINSAPGSKVSVDIPSGLYCDSGEDTGVHVNADITVSVISLKPVHILKPACSFCGQVVLANIGIPEECYRSVKSPLFTYKNEEIKSFFPSRPFDSNKGTFGKVLVIGGSYEMPGAAYLAAKAAVNSGAGLVKIAFPDVSYSAIASKTVEETLLPLRSNENGRISRDALKEIDKELRSASAVVLGCGLGVDSDTKEIVRFVLENSPVTVVLDADGINAVKDDLSVIDNARSTVILTPHPGEMARLTGESISEIQGNRGAVVKSFTELHRSVLVLKGASTLVGSSDNSSIFINTTGNAGMATGGSGDVLSGVIGAFCAQGLTPFKAAIAGAHIHGAIGDEVTKKYSMMGNTPSKMIAELPTVLRRFE